MQSNTRREGCDPAGAFSPAQRTYRPSFSFRLLAAAALAAGFLAGLFGLAR